MKLSRPVAFTSQISPVCLYTKTPTAYIKGIVTGWGITDTGK